MAFFDDFGKKISQASQSTIQKTKDMTDVARINRQISDEEKKMNDIYFQIGRLYVELHESDSEDAFKVMVQKVSDARNKIEEYKAQIQAIKGVLRCPQCGAEVGKDAQFCPACGNKISKAEEAQEETAADNF